MASTKRTIELLDALEELGFDDAAFAKLHHRIDQTIASHRKYMGEHESMHSDGTNARLQLRLQLVLNAYRAGPFKAGANVFQGLVAAALAEIPLAGGGGD